MAVGGHKDDRQPPVQLSLFTSLRNLSLLLTAFATGTQLVTGQSVNSIVGDPAEESAPIIRQRASLAGSLENNNGQLRLNLTNNSAVEFRGFARLSLGSDSDQKEIGQLELTLPAQETRLLRLSGVAASGNHYTLTIYDRKGGLVFSKIAPLKQVSDPTPELIVTLSPVSAVRSKSSSPSSPQTSPPTMGSTDANDPVVVSPDVQVQARLLASETDSDQFVIAFELSAPRPVYNATLSVTSGKRQESKPVSINLQSSIQFKMPDQPALEQISYVLTNKSGRVLAKGEIDLGQLMADDTVTVADIRTDRSGYDPGDSAKLTFVLEGKSPRGYRIEMAIKDGQGTVISRDQKQSSANDSSTTHEFSVALPRALTAPVVVEFKIFDADNGLLFDSGEREIPLNEKSKKP